MRKSRLTCGRDHDHTMSDSDDRGALVGEQSVSIVTPASVHSTQQASAPPTEPAAVHPISKPVNPDAPSLLTLPGEIRNGVYEALFKSESPVILTYEEYDNDWCRLASTVIWKGISLLVTCKQIHSEAAESAYSNNTFVFSQGHHMSTNDRTRAAADWMKSIGQEATLVKSVHIECGAPD